MPKITQMLQLDHGTAMEYTVTGAGQPILLFHGGHSNCQEDFGYKNLLEQGYCIITPSRPGYGKTSKKLGCSLESACEIYLRLIDHLNFSKVHVIAVSAGGPSGIKFASRYPGRVSSLTLQSAVTKEWHNNDITYKAARILFHPRTEKYTWKLISFLSSRFPKVMLKQMLPSFSTLPVTEILKQFSRQDIEQFVAMNQRQRSGHGFILDLEQNASLSHSDLQSVLCPTLIIHSKNDHTVVPGHAITAHEHILQSKLCLLETWGHLIWIGSGAQIVNATLNSFLLEIS
ncbi:alpha/beta hydrolase [Paenibacillus sp. MMS20-IR301]|uniref:alpha/beta fold hydrolase n=1 Tax=Paenibacillus sp. MMS20-IR301 TaxID=2895946 RepID=UPI0028F05B2B|nr:alpha/beta hydrolase [Paenibacillus sp. MMS20-IR301]WNS44142.1 alpha/beta hydrolase [Paenibacillus sp. MMS20-IR301]